jgi:hypothetical protein
MIKPILMRIIVLFFDGQMGFHYSYIIQKNASVHLRFKKYRNLQENFLDKKHDKRIGCPYFQIDPTG